MVQQLKQRRPRLRRNSARTDLYWARSRNIEHLQKISSRLPESVHRVIGPDATGAGWVYEYAIAD